MKKIDIMLSILALAFFLSGCVTITAPSAIDSQSRSSYTLEIGSQLVLYTEGLTLADITIDFITEDNRISGRFVGSEDTSEATIVDENGNTVATHTSDGWDEPGITPVPAPSVITSGSVLDIGLPETVVANVAPIQEKSCPIEEVSCPGDVTPSEYATCVESCKEVRKLAGDSLNAKVSLDSIDCFEDLPEVFTVDGKKYTTKDYLVTSGEVSQVFRQWQLANHCSVLTEDQLYVDGTDSFIRYAPYTQCIDRIKVEADRILVSIRDNYETCKADCTSKCFGVEPPRPPEETTNTLLPTTAPPSTTTGYETLPPTTAPPQTTSYDTLPPTTVPMTS